MSFSLSQPFFAFEKPVGAFSVLGYFFRELVGVFHSR
jgi:hypothetical protein